MNKRSNKTTSPELRKKLILGMLKEQDSVLTQDIVKECNASEITIRRDLTELERKGFLIRTHGGALKKKATDHLFTYNYKVALNKESKEYICKIASRYIKKNDIIFIESGSTLSFLPKYISKTDPITVITNSLALASELINFDNVNLILIGGEVMNERKAIYGHTAGKNIEMYHANKTFTGTDGISLVKGLTSYDEEEASITIKMAENADEVFLLCDSSKIEKNSFVSFAPISIVQYLITDKRLDPELASRYKRSNINLVNE